MNLQTIATTWWTEFEEWLRDDVFHKNKRRIRDLFRYIVKVGSYAKVLWNDRDWSYGFIFILLRYKLSRTRKCLLDNDFIVEAEKCAHQIRVAELVLTRLIEEDYCKVEHEAHTRKWGPIDFEDGKGMVRANANTPELERQERKEFMQIMNHEAFMMKQDMDYLFMYMRKHIQRWWD